MRHSVIENCIVIAGAADKHILPAEILPTNTEDGLRRLVSFIVTQTFPVLFYRFFMVYQKVTTIPKQ
jgi:hypothetical protein